MELKHDKVEYIITDDHSKNDGIMLGYLQTGLDNLIKDILHNQIVKIQLVSLDDMDSVEFSDIEEIRNRQGSFDWEYCEHLFLLRAYKNFTKKMKRVFDGFYIEDKPTNVLAKQEGCSVRVINDTLKRCREEIELQKRLEDAENAKKDNH